MDFSSPISAEGVEEDAVLCGFRLTEGSPEGRVDQT
jgi:hypothetical protein